MGNFFWTVLTRHKPENCSQFLFLLTWNSIFQFSLTDNMNTEASVGFSTVYSNTTTEKLETEEDKCEMLLCLIRNSHQSVFTADKHQTLQHDSNSSLQLTTDVLTAAMLGNQTRVLIKLQTDEQTCLTHHKSKQSSNTSISNNGSENQPKSEMSKTGLSCSLQTVRTRRTRRTRNHQTTTEQTKQTQ